MFASMAESDMRSESGYHLYSYFSPQVDSLGSALTKAVEPHVKQEDEGKFRCKTCQKLFKAPSFVEKHIVNKHSDLVKQLDEVGPQYGHVYL